MIIVIGTGLTGVTTAYYLAKAGHEVLVIEENECPAHRYSASHANGGQISVSHAEPWANPGVFSKLLKWLGRVDAPLRWTWNLNLKQWRWGLSFLHNCLPHMWRKNIKNIVNLATYSRDELIALRAEEGIEYDHLSCGIIHFYTDGDEWRAAEKATNLLEKYGCYRIGLQPRTIVELEPALKHAQSSIVGGTFTRADESGDARKFTQALQKKCEDMGVKFLFRTKALNILDNGKGVTCVDLNTLISYYSFCEKVIVCGGVYSPELVDDNLNIFPAKGCSITVDVLIPENIPEVSLTDDEYKMVFSRLGNKLRIAGTAEFSNYDLVIDPRRISALINRGIELFGEHSADWGGAASWIGLRPATPSNVPYIGPSKTMKNVYLNTGHGTLGWTMACGSAKAITDIIDGKKPAVDFDFYNLDKK
jgi:D-amino-acid dehydrogenase